MKKIVACLTVVILSSFALGLKAQDKMKVLWLGTSIPAGCTYPEVACEKNDLVCIKKAVGSSFLCTWSEDLTFHDYASGLSLTMSVAEKEAMFRKYVDRGVISEERLNFWKSTSYESLLLPYVKDVDIVVIDHGFNTPDHNSTEKHYNEGADGIDWDSEDRSDFIGAFNFIYRLIKTNNPRAMVVIGGYFQNSCTVGYFKRGLWASHVLTWIADHYHLPLLDAWNYTDIPDGYIPDSQNYLAELNAKYNTSFEKLYPDKDGNITYYQKFCPDGFHPFSDPTGHSDNVLNQVFVKLLSNIVHQETVKIDSSQYKGAFGETNYYGIDGIQGKKQSKGLVIVNGKDEKNTGQTKKCYGKILLIR